MFLAPGFLVWISVLIASALVIIFYFAPKYVPFLSSVSVCRVLRAAGRYGKKNLMWYIMVCSMIGGISVSVTTGLGAAIVTSVQGDNQVRSRIDR